MSLVEAHSGGVAVRCYVCEGTVFTQREVQINTQGMTSMGLDWANESGFGLACVRCGLLLTFVGNTLRVRPAEPPVQ